MGSDKLPSAAFNVDHAARYDEQWIKLSAMKDALHLFTRVVLADLSKDAHILCVGVGTGAELFDLAEHNPQWRFTVVDPAAPMLEICQRKAKEQGIEKRCTFHEGFLSTLPHTDKFDAATCILVSHFLTVVEERRALFTEIGSRLHPNGLLVNADIAGDTALADFKNLLSVWLKMMIYAGFSAENVEKMREKIGVEVAVLPPNEIKGIIEESGFCEPTLFFQSILVHAWYSRFGAG